MKKLLQAKLDGRAVGMGVLALVVLGACSQGAAPQSGVATSVAQLATDEPTLEARFNATAAVGGGINASNAVSADDVTSVLASVPGINQLKVTAKAKYIGLIIVPLTSCRSGCRSKRPANRR